VGWGVYRIVPVLPSFLHPCIADDLPTWRRNKGDGRRNCLFVGVMMVLIPKPRISTCASIHRSTMMPLIPEVALILQRMKECTRASRMGMHGGE